MLNAASAFASFPSGLRAPLLERYREIARNYAERRWEPAELNGGKFCEVVFTILEGALLGRFAQAPAKPPNLIDACRTLESQRAQPCRVGDRSLRVLIPRALVTLYEIRNNRGGGHVGGDVDPNFLDATLVFAMASWVMAELVRVFHGLSTEEAQRVVDGLVERKIPIIWELEGTRRVLDPNLSTRDQTLLLLYSQVGWISERDLASWVEYSGAAKFRKRILAPLHEQRLIEHDENNGRAMLSPRGVAEVESRLLTTLGF